MSQQHEKNDLTNGSYGSWYSTNCRWFKPLITSLFSSELSPRSVLIKENWPRWVNASAASDCSQKPHPKVIQALRREPWGGNSMKVPFTRKTTLLWTACPVPGKDLRTMKHGSNTLETRNVVHCLTSIWKKDEEFGWVGYFKFFAILVA